MKYLKLIFIATLIILLTTAASNNQDNITEMSISFTGDIIMHNNVKRCARVKSNKYGNAGFNYLFEKIKPVFKNSDYNCGNMEFPVKPPFISKGFIFNSPPQIVPALKHAGFDILNLANNHITDQGTSGLIYTLNLLEKHNIPYIGVSKDHTPGIRSFVLTKNDMKVGLISYTGWLNYTQRLKSKSYKINWMHDKKDLEKEIIRLKKETDIIILQLHYGTEYILNAPDYVKRKYRKAADMGADIIIGHHPHMIQNMETYETIDKRKVPIFYSLGNFISDQKRINKIPGTNRNISIKSSFIVKTIINKNDNISISINIIPVYTENYASYSGNYSYRDIQVKSISLEINRLQNELKKSNSLNRQKQIKDKIKYLKYQEKSIYMVLFDKTDKPKNIHFLWSN